jgi:hypothetical protein
MLELTDKEIADRVSAKHLEIITERKEVEDLRDADDIKVGEKVELNKILYKLRVKQYLLEDILGIE